MFVMVVKVIVAVTAAQRTQQADDTQQQHEQHTAATVNNTRHHHVQGLRNHRHSQSRQANRLQIIANTQKILLRRNSNTI